MTLEQFADLMGGLGYKAERREREKVKAPVEPVPPVEGASNSIPEETSPVAEAATQGESETPEAEVFFTFTWAPRPRGPRPDRAQRGEAEGEKRPAGGKAEFRRDGGKPDGKRDGKHGGKPGGKGKHGKGPKRDEQSRKYEARPPKKERPIDPDSPFAVLAALKGKT
jgi:ATP-dependent RNA helicase SUPV3L1/SUV3